MFSSTSYFSSLGNLVGEDSFERWMEHFEERATVAGWTGRKHRLKIHLRIHSKIIVIYQKKPKDIVDALCKDSKY